MGSNTPRIALAGGGEVAVLEIIIGKKGAGGGEKAERGWQKAEAGTGLGASDNRQVHFCRCSSER